MSDGTRHVEDLPAELVEELQSYDIDPDDFVEQLNSVDSKRGNIVIDEIIETGWVSTRELSEDYGYDHAPRAPRDVREEGVPLETFYPTEYSDRVGAYRFDLEAFGKDRHRGRTNFPDSFKKELIGEQGEQCAICQHEFEEQYLQIDHRVPYLVGGDPREKRRVENYMLVCKSCNRSKSWGCEHCENGTQTKDEEICKECYWASPESHSHVAMREERRIDIVWTGENIDLFEELRERARSNGVSVQEYIKNQVAE